MDKNLLKYGEWMKDLPECPPPNYKEVSITAYRWVFKDSGHPNNFTPRRMIRPDHVYRNAELMCKAWGLSFFDNFAGARDRLNILLDKTPNIIKEVGDHIATLSISPEDGIASEPESKNYGHFTFFEYICTDFTSKATTSEPISAK